MVYSTVRMDDPQLVERLYNAGASFGEVKPKEVSPWFSTLIMFVVFFPAVAVCDEKGHEQDGPASAMRWPSGNRMRRYM